MLYNTLLRISELNPVLPKIVKIAGGDFIKIGKKVYESLGIEVSSDFDGLFYKAILSPNIKIKGMTLICDGIPIGRMEINKLDNGVITGAVMMFN